MIVAGLAAGAAWALIPGFLKAYLSTNEIITSLMLNYVAGLFLTYLIFDSHSYWRDTTSASAAVFPVGKSLPDAASWPTFGSSVVVPFGFVLGIVAAILLWVLYSRTRFGFEVQVMSDSPRAARYSGMRTRRKILAVMALSGALAGLGGASQVGDFSHTLDADPNGLRAYGYGYTGIVVAALARYNPFAVVLVAFLLGGLQNAGLGAPGAGLPVGARRRDGGHDPVHGARRRAPRPLPDPLRPPPACSGRGRPAEGSAVNNSILVVVIASGIAYGTPLLFAALGELLAERSGVLNLGVEGMMLVGAVMGFWAVQHIGGPGRTALFLAVLVAALAGAAVALLFAFLVITLRANQIVSGLALTIFAGAAGLSSYLGNDLGLADAPAKHQFEPVDPFGLADVPILGPILFGQTWLVYASWARRRADRALPGPDPARAERPRRRRVAADGRRDGDQRLRLPLRARRRGRRPRRASAGPASASR